jgi:hypothetical protein
MTLSRRSPNRHVFCETQSKRSVELYRGRKLDPYIRVRRNQANITDTLATPHHRLYSKSKIDAYVTESLHLE